jgi:2-keto-myo-inositol isomerase
MEAGRPELGLNSWTTGAAVALATDIAVAAAAGFDRLELCDWKIERHLAAGGTLPEIRRRLDGSGLRLLSVNTLDDATLHEGERAAALVERCRTLCGYAAALGAPVVIVGPSYRRDGFAGLGAAEIRQRTAAALGRYAAVAAEAGVAIGFEFHGYAACSIHTLADAKAALDAHGDPRVGLVLDAFHLYVGGTPLEDVAELDAARLLILHLADVDHADRATLGKPNRIMPGLGVLPLAPLVVAVRLAGYAGPWSLELFRQEYWDMDPLIVARRGLASLRALA